MIPRAPSNLKRRPFLERFMFGGIEALTAWVMRADDVITDEDERDFEEFFRRVDGLRNAIAARKRAAGIVEDVIE